LRGTCSVREPAKTPRNAVQCDSFELVGEASAESKRRYAKSAVIQHEEQDAVRGRTIVQRHGDVMLVQNPPQRSLTESEMDRIYALPFTRLAHPMYDKVGGVPALREVEFSITWTRGCFGACNFCALSLHQGTRIQTRSEKSVVREAEGFVNNPDFKGYIHDVGGPTANFGQPACERQIQHGSCRNRKCLTAEGGGSKPCANLNTSHDKFLRILRKLRKVDGVKKVFVRSGVRYDFAMSDKGSDFLRELVTHHVSGQLKVAPEHCKSNVLSLMGKPAISVYERFCELFATLSKQAGKEQYLVPYLMSSHPGATLDDAVDMAVWLKKRRIRPEQVQDFYPTPGTISTAMYYTGLNPYTLEKIYVAKSPQQKSTQRNLLQYYKPENAALLDKLLKARLKSKDNRGQNNVKNKKITKKIPKKKK
jgi:uncharacterized radical SAM protein YgiQ